MNYIVEPRPPLGCAAVLLGLFRAALQEHRLPVTQQREAVARTLFESGQILSADEIAERLRTAGVRVAKATVYRTLDLLVRFDLASEHDFDEGFKRYEMRVGPANHCHLICSACGEIVHCWHETLNRFHSEVAQQFGFHVLGRQLKLYGLCADCHGKSGQPIGQAARDGAWS